MGQAKPKKDFPLSFGFSGKLLHQQLHKGEEEITVSYPTEFI